MKISDIEKINPQPGWRFRTKDGEEKELKKVHIDKDADSVIIFGPFFTASISDIDEFIPPKDELCPT